MDDKERRQFEMLVRVRDFAAENAADFAPKTLAGKLVAEINAAIEALQQSGAAKSSSQAARREGAAQKAAAREELREDLAIISRTARAMAIDAPGLEQKFRMPRGNGDQELLNAARAFAADAAALAAGFVEYGLPDDFIADLNQDIRAFEAVAGTPAQARTSAVAANAEIDDRIEQGTRAARKLDAVVANKYRANPAKLAAWTSASHTERAPRATEKSNNPPKT